MAILDTTYVSGSLTQDRDSNVHIGIDLPIRNADNSEGFFATTKTTIGAVKNNIRNLMLTNAGERIMQPNFGMSLRKFLFEQISSDTILQIQTEIQEKISQFLPFVIVKDISVNMSEVQDRLGINKLNINVVFSISQDPNTLESLEIEVGGD